MQTFPKFALAIALICGPCSAFASDEVAADRNPLLLGQPVTLNWYFTGTKVTVSGGGFGKGVEVTGKTSITDRPAKTTTYTFDVDYIGAPAGITEPMGKPVHVTYSTTVEVVDPKAMGLTTYANPYGWSISYLSTWKKDKEDLPDPANNAMFYFQPEEDSIERVAVAVLPVKETSVASLVKSIKADLPSRYNAPEILSEQEITYEGQPAQLLRFTGMDNTHPGTKTQTVLLAFVKGMRGYVISARTDAAKFPLRQKALETMVKTFCFTPPGQRVSDGAAKRPAGP